MARARLPRWSLMPVLAVALIVLAPPPLARGDGDPASDYLIANQVFLTSQSGNVSPAQRRLLALVRDANRRGFAIRVAVISSEYDLGSITPLWLKPGLYARFLGVELATRYRQRLLVVMPNGFGFNWAGHSAAPATRLLAEQRTSDQNGLAGPAQAAVRALATAAGVALGRAPSRAPSPGRAGNPDVAAIAAVGVAAVAVLAGLTIGASRVRRARPKVARRSERPGPARRLRPAQVIPVAALFAALAVAAPILALRRSGGSSLSPASVATPPPFGWPANRQPAPAFTLRDQAGRAVSVDAYRGRDVIVTFIDPLCRNLCPLEAQVLNQAERQLPAGRRPAILAVSVDVYANTRADLIQDVHEWHLVPEWRWAVGAPSQLAAVWNRYHIGVNVVTKRIAATTIHYITHTEAAYVVDRTGHERALFLWPFYPQDLIRELGRLA